MAQQGAGGEQERTVGRLVRDNLAFLLGLVPVLIAMLRVAMAAQGDYGVVVTLVRTLDVPALIVGTFVRSIGLLLAAASLYVIFRVCRRGSGMADGPEPSRSLFPVLVVIGVIGMLAIYPEELVDTDTYTFWKAVLPDDLVRSVLWAAAVCGLVCLPSWLRKAWRWMMADPAEEPAAPDTSTSSGPETKGYIRTHQPELFIIAPVALSLFWNNVAANERMWLPSEVITVTAASSVKHSVPNGDLDFPAEDVNRPVIRWKGDTLIIVAYVLASDAQSLTVTTPAGGIYQLPNGSNVTRQVCQDIAEPRPDQVLDAPLLFRLPGQHTQPSSNQTPICKDLIAPS